MDLQEFTFSIQNQFIDSQIIMTPETDFRDNDEFDSLIGMSILVMIKDYFDYEMSLSEFLSSNTPRDLYNIIMDQKK